MSYFSCSIKLEGLSRAHLQAAVTVLPLLLSLVWASASTAQSLNGSSADNENLKFLNDRSFSKPVLVT